jgi:hypothetical protein
MCDLKVSASKKSLKGRKILEIDHVGLRELLGEDGTGGKRSSIPLHPNGYVCIMNAPIDDEDVDNEDEGNKDNDKDAAATSTHLGLKDEGPIGATSPLNRLFQQNTSEHEFFEENQLSDLLQEHSQRAGSNALVNRLNTLYTQYLTQTWLPKTIFLVCSKISSLQIPMTALGVPDYSNLTLLKTNKKSGIFLNECLACVEAAFILPKHAQVDEIITGSINELLFGIDDASPAKADSIQALARVMSVEYREPSGTMMLTRRGVAYRDVDAALNTVVEHLLRYLEANLYPQFFAVWTNTDSSFSASMSNDSSSFKFGRFGELVQSLEVLFKAEVRQICESALVRVQTYLKTMTSRAPNQYATLAKRGTNTATNECSGIVKPGETEGGTNVVQSSSSSVKLDHTLYVTVQWESLVCDLVHTILSQSTTEIISRLRTLVVDAVNSLDNEAHVESQATRDSRKSIQAEIDLLTKIHSQLVHAMEEAMKQPSLPQDVSAADDHKKDVMYDNNGSVDNKSAMSRSKELQSGPSCDPVVMDGIITSPANSITAACRETFTEDMSQIRASTSSIATQRILEQTMESLHRQHEADFFQGIDCLRKDLSLKPKHKAALLTQARLLQEGMVTTAELDMLRKLENRTVSGNDITSSERQRFRDYHTKQGELFLDRVRLVSANRTEGIGHEQDEAVLTILKRCPAFRHHSSIASIAQTHNFETVFEAHFGVFVKAATVAASAYPSGKSSNKASWTGTADIINESCLGKMFTQQQHAAVQNLAGNCIDNTTVDKATASVLLDIFEHVSVVAEGVGIYGKSRSISQRWTQSMEAGQSQTRALQGDELFVSHVLKAWSRQLSVSEATAVELMKLAQTFPNAQKLNRARNHLHIEDVAQLTSVCLMTPSLFSSKAKSLQLATESGVSSTTTTDPHESTTSPGKQPDTRSTCKDVVNEPAKDLEEDIDCHRETSSSSSSSGASDSPRNTMVNAASQSYHADSKRVSFSFDEAAMDTQLPMRKASSKTNLVAIDEH